MSLSEELRSLNPEFVKRVTNAFLDKVVDDDLSVEEVYSAEKEECYAIYEDGIGLTIKDRLDRFDGFTEEQRVFIMIGVGLMNAITIEIAEVQELEQKQSGSTPTA